ncbi:hypothetical protein FQA39_LY17079 [Lamprigera yunnana]|nr:hypothetical protein FQA39_LY17079 [Lamprigera yunnana]
MESTLNEENTKLVKLVYQLKMDNKNLCKEISDLKCMLEIKSHRFINVVPKCTQTDIAYRDSVSQTTSTLPRVDAVTASRSDKCSQTAVDVRNISAQTHSSPTVNKLAGSNLIKMRKKHDLACNKKINSIQNVTNKSLFEELKEILPPIQINHFSTSLTSVSSIHVSQKKSSTQKTTPRILILADSQGRNLANKFRDRLSPNYSVLYIFKPNATFEQTTCDLHGLTLDFNKGDHVIIMAGTNDALVKNYISDNSIEKTVAGLSHTNCLFVAVPYVYHCNYRYFNNLAYKKNYQFQFIANNYSSRQNKVGMVCL